MAPRTRLFAIGAGVLALIGAAALAIGGSDEPRGLQARRVEERPRLLLLTSLPLVFAEEFALEGGSPALVALERRYTVVPIGTADAASLRQAGLLLMAHPLAQPAENLVELDAWVRGGGRVLLLADPRLEWPSRLPLGDRLRPPPSFADTGLLAHWGLRLDAPDEPGARTVEVEGRKVRTLSPGSLRGGCRIGSGGLVARCRIGRGHATVIADADFLNVEQVGEPAKGNLDALLAELATLERASTH